ncbi:MAG: S4 domain-containing protein, partial [Candidatus Saccharimonadales bacterium]
MGKIVISEAQRLDQKVIGMLPGLSRSYAASLIKKGKVKLNKKVLKK